MSRKIVKSIVLAFYYIINSIFFKSYNYYCDIIVIIQSQREVNTGVHTCTNKTYFWLFLMFGFLQL